MLQTAHRIGKLVKLGSIIPRTDNSRAQLKSENVNLKFKELCERNINTQFVNNDPSFRLADMSINNGFLLPDGLHLSPQGSEKLIKNFNVKASVRRSTRSTRLAPGQIPNPHFQWQQRPSFVHNIPQNIEQKTPLHPIPSYSYMS